MALVLMSVPNHTPSMALSANTFLWRVSCFVFGGLKRTHSPNSAIGSLQS